MSKKLAVSPSVSQSDSIKLVEPETLLDHIHQINDAIARRAFELFEGDGRINGRDQGHWLQAEEELLHRVHVRISQSDQSLDVRAEVPGFRANELEVCLEPRRLTIAGKKDSIKEYKEKQTVYQERCSDEILRVIDLPAEVNSSGAKANLKNGILELTLPKASQTKATQLSVKAAGGA
jgi:HSP20 family molecular chaperone IbpA